MSRRNGLTRRYVELVVRHKTWALLSVVLLTALAGASISQMVMGAPFKGMFPADDFAEYRERTRQFGSDLVLVMGIEDPGFLTPAGQKRLRQAVDAIQAFPGVKKVRSVLDAVHLEPGPLFPIPIRYVDEARDDPSRIPELKRRLARDPLTGGLLVGRDGESLSVIIVLKADLANDPVRARPGRNWADCFSAVYPPQRLHPVGLPVVTREILRQTKIAIWQTAPAVALVLLLCVWLLFGRLWPAAIALVIAVVAVIWTVGAAGAVDPEFHILMSVIPGVMLIIAFSDVVHLCSAYLLELEAGRPKEEAILEACSDVGRACLFTSLTTCVGFVGLAFVPSPSFQTLGLTLGLGVGIALFLAVTLTPLAFSFLPAPRPLRDGPARLPQRAIDHGLATVRALAVRHPGWVIGVFAVLSVASALGATRLEIETDFLARLSEDNQVRVDTGWFNERFHGTNVVHVFVKAPSPQDIHDPEWLSRVATFEEKLRGERGVRQVSSVLGVLSAIHHATPLGRGAPPGALPESHQQLRLIQGLLELGAGSDLRGLVDRGAGRLRLLVALEDLGMRDTAAVAGRLEALGARHLPSGSDIQVMSLYSMAGEYLDVVFGAQQEGLAITMLVITVLMVLGLRSVRVGVGSMLPNLLPLAVIAACLGVFWDRVDSDCLILTFIALGIGVDDTIHFLIRFRLEVLRGLPRAQAIERTFAFAGRGIVMTTVILGVGFLPFLLSDYFLMRMVGWLLPLCFLVALLADLLLIPAMAQVGWLRFDADEQPDSTQAAGT